MRGEDFVKLDAVSKNIKEGSIEAYLTGDGVAIGSRMAVDLGLVPGDLIKIISPEGDITPFGTTPRVKSYPVRAVFEMGMSEYDRSIIFMPLAEAQAYFIAAANGALGGGLVPVPGGVLLRDAGGAVIGAVGVSGDASDNDEAAALAGAEAAGIAAEA